MAINYDRNLDEMVEIPMRKRSALELLRVLREIMNDRPLSEMLSVDEFRDEILNDILLYIKTVLGK